MRNITPVIIFVLALALAVATIYGDKGYSKLKKLSSEKVIAEKANLELENEVKAIKKRVWALKKDPATLEKTARNSYALARPDEKVFFFKDQNK